MGKILPVCFLFFTVVLLFPQRSFAQVVTSAPSSSPSPAPSISPSVTPTGIPDGTWVEDPDVTFTGKVASRSGSFLDWTIKDYRWLFIPTGKDNPLISFWIQVRNIVYAFLVLIVLSGAFIMLLSRGRSITVMKFVPRFILMLLLVTFSFSLIQFLYQITDIIQGFFLKNPAGVVISSKDLLHVGFDYKNFEGYRLSGSGYDESVTISLLLIKLTSLTYYVLAGILLIRKIILWFFVIVSPIFPFLLLYYPIRNTAKIWIGEFFKWLLYAPIFSILLSGLVSLWSTYIPLKFDFSSVGSLSSVMYPTATSILLGGPGQNVSLSNSINLPDTFALYVVSLLMLWIVILLPFLLLQIFLDYMHTISLDENSQIRKMINASSLFMNKTVRSPAFKFPSLSRSKNIQVSSSPVTYNNFENVSQVQNSQEESQ